MNTADLEELAPQFEGTRSMAVYLTFEKILFLHKVFDDYVELAGYLGAEQGELDKFNVPAEEVRASLQAAIDADRNRIRDNHPDIESIHDQPVGAQLMHRGIS